MKPGTRVTINYATLTPGNAAYWRAQVGDTVGTVAAVDANGRVRVEFGSGRHGLFAPESLTGEVVQRELFA